MTTLLLIFCLVMLAVPSVASAQSAPRQDTEEETIAKCLDDLQSQDVNRRRRAAMLIGKYDTPEAEAAVVRCLSDEDAQVRQSALVALTEERGLPFGAGIQVFRLLKDDNVHIRRLASSILPEALGVSLSGPVSLNPELRLQARGSRAEEDNLLILKLMNEALHDEDASVRRNVLAASRYFSMPLSQRDLAPFLQDSDKELRCLALLAYQRIIGNEAERAKEIAPLSGDPVPQVRSILCAVAASLGEAGSPILKRLFEDADANVRFEAISKYAQQFQPDSFSILQDAILDESIPASLRVKLCAQLRYFRKEAGDFAKSLLEHPNNSIKAAALQLFASNAFGELPTEYLLSLVDSEDAEIRQSTIRILQARLRNPPPARDVIERLFASPYSNVRILALNLARSLPNKKEYEQLFLDAMLDDDVTVRKTALQSLTFLRPEGFEELLITSLEDEEAEIRETAANTLCIGLPNPKVAEALKKALPALQKPFVVSRVNNYLERYERRTEGSNNRPQGNAVQSHPIRPNGARPYRTIRTLPQANPRPLSPRQANPMLKPQPIPEPKSKGEPGSDNTTKP